MIENGRSLLGHCAAWELNKYIVPTVADVVEANLSMEQRAKLVLLKFYFLRSMEPTNFHGETVNETGRVSLNLILPCMLRGRRIDILMQMQGHDDYDTGTVLFTASVMRAFHKVIADLDISL